LPCLSLAKDHHADLVTDLQISQRGQYVFRCVERDPIERGDNVATEQEIVSVDRYLQVAALKLGLVCRAPRLDGFDQKAGSKRESQQSLQAMQRKNPL
jgi:hypothetical protein